MKLIAMRTNISISKLSAEISMFTHGSENYVIVVMSPEIGPTFQLLGVNRARTIRHVTSPAFIKYSEIVKMTQFSVFLTAYAGLQSRCGFYGNCVLITAWDKKTLNSTCCSRLTLLCLSEWGAEVGRSFECHGKQNNFLRQNILNGQTKWEWSKKPRGESLKPRRRLDYEKQLNNFYVVRQRKKNLYLVFDFWLRSCIRKSLSRAFFLWAKLEHCFEIVSLINAK